MTADHNPFYDGRTVFSLDVAQLRPGDIVLTRNRLDESSKGCIQSSVIAVAGKSNFSHALICAQPPTMIEAIGSGVSTLSIANTFFHEERDVRVLRYGDPIISKRAAAKAGLFLGKGYSVRMAIKSVLPSNTGANEPMVKTFCSALVAAAYRASSASEFQSINPYQITPGDLTRMVFLTDVTSQVTRPMLAPRNVEKMTALDGERRASPFDGQAKALFELHASVADDVEAFIHQWGLSLEVPTTFFETLEFLVSALKWATQGDDPHKKAYIPALRSIDQKLADAFDQSDLSQMNMRADAKDAESLARDVRESFEPNPDIDVDAARAILEATAGQIASRSWLLEDKHRAAGLSHAWDRWCDLSASSIDALKNRQTILREILDRIDPL
ncbi:hypothetical protein C357_00789 [Citreicella sp. 357]|nr:hypothetical protein C357_00789 [Citreicella sp. 357]